MKAEIINIVIVLLVLIASGIAVFTNYWNSNSLSNQGITAKNNKGLWKLCTNLSTPNNMGNLNECVDLTDSKLGSPPKSLLTVKIFAISGLVLLIVSIFLLFLAPDNQELFIVSVLLGGACAIAAATIWATDKQLKASSDKFGYSWYLELIGGIIGVIFGLLVQFNVLK